MFGTLEAIVFHKLPMIATLRHPADLPDDLFTFGTNKGH